MCKPLVEKSCPGRGVEQCGKAARKRLRASPIKKSKEGWTKGSAVLGEVKKLIAVSDTPKAPEKKSGKKAEVRQCPSVSPIWTPERPAPVPGREWMGGEDRGCRMRNDRQLGGERSHAIELTPTLCDLFQRT